MDAARPDRFRPGRRQRCAGPDPPRRSERRSGPERPARLPVRNRRGSARLDGERRHRDRQGQRQGGHRGPGVRPHFAESRRRQATHLRRGVLQRLGQGGNGDAGTRSQRTEDGHGAQPPTRVAVLQAGDPLTRIGSSLLIGTVAKIDSSPGAAVRTRSPSRRSLAHVRRRRSEFFMVRAGSRKNRKRLSRFSLKSGR